MKKYSSLAIILVILNSAVLQAMDKSCLIDQLYVWTQAYNVAQGAPNVNDAYIGVSLSEESDGLIVKVFQSFFKKFSVKIRNIEEALIAVEYDRGSVIRCALSLGFKEAFEKLKKCNFLNAIEKTTTNKKLVIYLCLLQSCKNLSLSYSTEDAMSLQDYYSDALAYATPLEEVSQSIKLELVPELQENITLIADEIKTEELPDLVQTQEDVKNYINNISNQVFEAVAQTILKYLES